MFVKPELNVTSSKTELSRLHVYAFVYLFLCCQTCKQCCDALSCSSAQFEMFYHNRTCTKKRLTEPRFHKLISEVSKDDGHHQSKTLECFVLNILRLPLNQLHCVYDSTGVAHPRVVSVSFPHSCVCSVCFQDFKFVLYMCNMCSACLQFPLRLSFTFYSAP